MKGTHQSPLGTRNRHLLTHLGTSTQLVLDQLLPPAVFCPVKEHKHI